MHVVAVVVARAGPGGLDAPGGVPLVARSARALARTGEVHVCGQGASDVDVLRGLPGVSTHDDARGVVEALRRRAHTTQRGGGTVGDDAVTGGFVLLVHDAARPLVPEVLGAVVAAARAGHPVVVPVLPLVDTVKEVAPDGRIVSTPDRAGLRVVQTPQGFHPWLAERVLPAACADPGHAWAAAGEPAHAVPGDPRASAVHGPFEEDA